MAHSAIWAIALVAASLLIAAAIAPEIDAAVARFFWSPADAGPSGAHSTARAVARIFPIVLCAAVSINLATQAVRNRARAGLALRRIAFLIATIGLGPGILVNGLIKERSHRPRPSQTTQVAGVGAEFRPFYSFDGACHRNCSFSSGEAAAAFWTTAPALLAPAPSQAIAVAAALGFGIVVSLMRMAAGAHYLSDVAFSALLVLLLTMIGWRVVVLRETHVDDR